MHATIHHGEDKRHHHAALIRAYVRQPRPKGAQTHDIGGAQVEEEVAAAADPAFGGTDESNKPRKDLTTAVIQYQGNDREAELLAIAGERAVPAG